MPPDDGEPLVTDRLACEHTMKCPAATSLRILLVAGGLLCWLLAAGSAALLLESRSNPWLVGIQNEPYWSWAVGSGRLKTWVAEPVLWKEKYGWTSSWYRGLDGQPLRWDVTVHRGSTGGVIVVAIPLWASTVVGLAGGMICIGAWRRQRSATVRAKSFVSIHSSSR